MSLLDIIIIAIVIAFTLVSAVWGVIRQVIAVGGLLFGIWLGSIFNTPVAGFLGFLNNPQVAKGVAFVGIVLLVSAAASVVASILYFVSGLLFLGLFDHIMGAALGFIQGVLMIGIFLVAALTIFPDWTQQQLAKSFLANKVVGALTSLALLAAPQDLKDIVQNARNHL